MNGLRQFTETVGEAVLGGVGRVASRVQERKPLPADVLESDDAYLVVFDAPGTEIGDVQVRYDEGTVRVRVERFREFHEGYEMLFPGRGLTLEGTASLPDDAVVDPRAASATLAANGTLRVEVPKADDVTDAPVRADSDPDATDDDVDETDGALSSGVAVEDVQAGGEESGSGEASGGDVTGEASDYERDDESDEEFGETTGDRTT